jgi:Lamin Tail Domain/Secretion system C-terminal sorting domain
MKKLFTIVLALTLTLSANAQLKILEVYGGGGSTSATAAYKNDYVVLKNLGTSAVDLSAYSIQYGSATGGIDPAPWSSRGALSGTIAAGDCFFIKMSADNATYMGGTLPTANLVLDATNTFLAAGTAANGISMSGTSGKIALVSGQTMITNATTATVIDKIGYGVANNSEGSPTATLSITLSAKRKGNGSVDTDNNLADFDVVTAVAVACTIIVVPVELVSITAKQKGNRNAVAWQTASELNNNYFDIQRSTDGATFQNIGQVKGAGNSVALNNYEFMDETPIIGTNYYRLQQVDVNGKTTTSKTVAVNATGKGSVKVFPTLATDKLNVLTTSEKEESFEIVNFVGQVVLKGRFNNSTDVNISQLAKGNYIMHIAGETVKFSKQ